jgi:hypothetical protein
MRRKEKFFILHACSATLCSSRYLSKEIDAAVKVILLKTEVIGSK